MKDMLTTVRGNATGTPTTMHHKDGTTSAKVRVAVNGRYYDPSTGEYADRKTEFVNIYARRSLARHVLASVQKGEPLIATGRLGSSEWQREDGTTEYSLTLQAESVGHDLSFGTSRFERSQRRADLDIDEHTGEIIGPDRAASASAGGGGDDAVGEGAGEGALVAVGATSDGSARDGEPPF